VVDPSVPISDAARANPPESMRDVLVAVVTRWSWRYRLSRSQFWTTMSIVVVGDVLVGALTRSLYTAHQALSIVFVIVTAKCLMWRYRDAGINPFWVLVQGVMFFGGAACLILAGVLEFVHLLGGDVNNGRLEALGLVGLALALSSLVWVVVWAVMPSRPAVADHD
jgi:hypothetical protein